MLRIKCIGNSLFCLLTVAACLTISFSAGAKVKDTKHNLSATGPGTIKAFDETQICVFCHTPHNANPVYPLWNHEITAVEDYVNYWSPTLKSYASEAEAPPIDGFSKLCLSCHDGTVAVGAIYTSPFDEIDMLIRFIPPDSPGYLGTDLSGGHPISIIFDEQLVMQRNMDPNIMHLNWPITDKDVRLYRTQGGMGIQCTSCHDPHGGKGGPEAPPFWRKSTYDEVCLVCHDDTAQIGH